VENGLLFVTLLSVAPQTRLWKRALNVCFASPFVSSSISLYTIVVADDQMLAEPEATVRVSVHSCRQLGNLCRVPSLKHYGSVYGKFFVGSKV
jgi:hypothetical protein